MTSGAFKMSWELLSLLQSVDRFLEALLVVKQTTY